MNTHQMQIRVDQSRFLHLAPVCDLKLFIAFRPWEIILFEIVSTWKMLFLFR